MNKFLRAMLIRALKTVCQTAIAMIGTSVYLTDVNWFLVISASVLAGILSVLTSITVGLPEVKYEQHLYMQADEPVDSEVADDEDE